MKKFLLTLVGLLAITTASADSYTITFASTTGADGTKAITGIDDLIKEGQSYLTEATASYVYQGKSGYGLKFSSSKNGGSLTLTPSADYQVNVTSIEVKASAWKATEVASLAVKIGDSEAVTNKLASAADNLTNYTYEFTGEKATSIVLTATKRLYVESITVNYSASGEIKEYVATPTFSADGTVEVGTKVSISCATEGATIYYTLDGTEPTTASNRYAEPIEISKNVTIKAIAVKEGLENSRIATAVLTVPTKVNSIAEAIALENDTEAMINCELTVGFVNFNNIFVCDSEGKFIQIYGSNSYKVGDVIPAGWVGKYTLYNNVTPELIPVGELPAATEGTFTPAAVEANAVTAELVNNVIVINDVKFAEATKADKGNFTGTVGETELSFRNNYEIASVEAGNYNVTCVVTIYNNNVQLYVVSYEPAINSGVDDVVADDANAPVEYYNLQGVRVENPENGLYIKRQGSTVTKVIIR